MALNHEEAGDFIAAYHKAEEAITFTKEKLKEIQTELLAKHIALKIGKRDAHTEHCCVIHGCKYGKPDCPVETRASTQSYPCESCQYDNW
jgi:hypothetical protein